MIIKSKLPSASSKFLSLKSTLRLWNLILNYLMIGLLLRININSINLALKNKEEKYLESLPDPTSELN